MPRSPRTDATDAQRRRILDAAEVVLRRHGPNKANVVDIAREIGQTHASVYRYFTDKSELFDALVERWLETVSNPLEAIARGEGPAADRLKAWLLTLFHAKVRKVTADPEMFATYQAIAEGSHEVIARHLATITGQVEAIVASGIASGEFPATDPQRAARTLLNASLRFHHPALMAHPAVPPTVAEAEDVFALLVAGLRTGAMDGPDVPIPQRD